MYNTILYADVGVSNVVSYPAERLQEAFNTLQKEKFILL